MREWIVTNGLGSYASLTHSGETISKFHGLLAASLEPPTKRWMFVSNVIDRIQSKEQVISLKDQKCRFLFDSFPSLLYQFDGVYLKKTFFMEYGKNTSIIKYTITTNKPLVLSHIPIINSRHFYDMTSPGSASFSQNVIEQGVSVNLENCQQTLKILLKNSCYLPDGFWEEFFYKKDKERYDSWRDHNFHIGEFQVPLKQSAEYYLMFTIENEPWDDPSQIYDREMQRKERLLTQAMLPHACDKLVLSTDNFVVQKGSGKSIVAGYHWFSDWGRDTLIALPGITLVTKRFDDAKQILENYGKYCRKGLIPNVFAERDSQPMYNTVDASLWYVDRVYQYLKYTNDLQCVEALWPTLQSIIDHYKNGTDFGIHMDNDFLISHGEGLTWMDVKIGNSYITPRSKKAVEIQALWYNALRIMSTLATFLEKENQYSELAENVKKSFRQQYIRPYDVIDTKDLSMRPNQIFLVSIDFPMIEKQMQRWIVDEVQKSLVTIFGLRSLSPQDPRYKGTYLGNHHRDYAYHNGTVWPWLLGPFIKAYIKVHDHDATHRRYAFHTFLQPMLDVYGESWDGSLHEIFDGDPPFAPQGCISQAWSVAEVLRTWVEDIENMTPRYESLLLHEIGV
ncbi:MAG: glycogen debranching enzyme family protein [Candidatus Thermoplasmatota archaeon]|nr:glycogen debranching enzyme family protein [Candidatus Thermoplasmatota archaeon]